ncbi:MAG: type II secretion system inner membrane protein GspF [Proteobacteria bacterium]|nr:type II secretion system inner membrane protein GspF [Pseudomonadota bacterium]MBU1233332.1 type II secretion system inner membrane protein GspF [Pseudomonadota bacterium]MBU1419785.1 type II secretion system inner membrane protein GspF [Pseudomonadota bacterium]MBU1456753.1 type II secretion system inner membrane protein GspF [Pseudomonadota bacterium]
MPVYEYNALDQKGKSCKGLIDADNESSARSKLRAAGKYPVSLRESLNKGEKNRKQSFSNGLLFDRIKSDETYIFTRQLATLLGAGIPLINALASIIEQSSNPALKRVLAQVRDSVNEGSTLTNALARHPKLFSNIYINMVRSGEASGSLDIVLERLADFGEKQKALQGRLKAALIYPIFMAVIGTGILFFLISYIVPNITRVFTDMERVLPLPTRMLIFLSDALLNYWWLGVLLLLVFIFSIRLFLAQEKGRRIWDRIKLSLPVTGSVTRKIILARFASTLGSLLNSGVPLITSLQIVNSIVNSRPIGEVIEEAMEQIRKGKSMSHALESSVWFPPIFIQMIGVGEQSGQLEPMLEKVAQTYEREVETAILGMTSLIEPIMITAMGAAVGFVVLSILLPIFEMNQMI